MDPTTVAPIPPAEPAEKQPSHRRLTVFRVLAVLPVILFATNATNLLAPWTVVLSQSDDHPEPHRWFFTVSAAADLLLLAAFVGLVLRPRLTGLAAWVLIALGIVLLTIVPLQPAFLVLVGIIVAPATIAYPYWHDLRAWRGWWHWDRLVAFAAVMCVVLLVVSVIAFRRQVVRDDAVTDANWWNDYAEHIADIGVAGVLAASAAPGRLVLRGVLAGIWLYLGIIAVFVLPDAIGSWGVAGGLAGIAVGLVFGYSTWAALDHHVPLVPHQRVAPQH